MKKTATVDSNDPKNPRINLVLNVDVIKIFKGKPFDRLFISTPVGKPVVQTITLTNVLNDPIEITGLDMKVPDLDVSYQEIEKGKVYQITLKTKAEATVRRYALAKLALKGAPVEAVDLPVYLNVWKPRPKNKTSGVRQPVSPKVVHVAPPKAPVTPKAPKAQ